MKYIVTKQDDGTEELFMFPREINHDAMMEALRMMRNQTYGQWQRIFRTPIAAGFVDGNVCYGQSETLGLKARKEDKELLERSFPNGR